MHYGGRTCHIHQWISNMFSIKHRNILNSCLITSALDIIILAILCNNYISNGRENLSKLVLQIVPLFCMISLCRHTWSSPKFSSDGYEKGSWASPCPSVAVNTGHFRPWIKVLQLRRCRPSGHIQSLRREDSRSIPSHGQPSGHDSVRQCLLSLRTSSMNRAIPSLFYICTRTSSNSICAHGQTGSDKLRKVYHGQSEGKRWSVHMTQIKLWAIVYYLG